jgi:hypothetical protein
VSMIDDEANGHSLTGFAERQTKLICSRMLAVLRGSN